MTKLDPLLQDIEEFYDAARNLRQDMRSSDDDIQLKAAQRMKIIPGWRDLSDEDIISTPIPLKMGKFVIALEHDFPTWGELRIKVGEEQMKRMGDFDLEPKEEGEEGSVGGDSETALEEKTEDADV